MESNLQFQSVQLDRESTDPEKGSCTSIDDDFTAEFSSAENSIHTPAPSENSRSSAQRRTRPRNGKRAVEEKTAIKIGRQKLDLMQSMGNGHVDLDTNVPFLDESQGTHQYISREYANENSKDHISGDPKTQRHPK